MSSITFNNNIILHQLLVDNESKTLTQMRDQISRPDRTLTIKSMFDYPGNGRIYYVNPSLAN